METANSEIKSDINITPLVDVVLVLLIIFMVVTPMMISRQIQLPETHNPGEQEPLNQKIIYLNQAGDLFFEETPMIAETLVERLRELQLKQPEMQIVLKADRRLQYSLVFDALELIAKGGFSQVGLIAQPSVQSAR